MMRIQIIQIGETKNQHLRALELEYEKWLSPLVKWKELNGKASTSDQPQKAKMEEAEWILEAIESSSYCIALTPGGHTFTSEAWAQKIEWLKDREGEITFVIGGSHGLHENVLKFCREQWSLSPLTFTHEMTRVILKEQMFRAFSILNGKTYHK